MSEAGVLRTVLTADISNFTRNMGRAADTLDGFGKVAKLVAGVFVAGKILQGFESVVKAADEQDAANRKLALSLANTGALSDANVAAFDDLATQLQKTTKTSDDAALGMASLALNLGATAKQALQIVPAALDMSAALGISADEATRALTLSLNGNIKALGKIIPEVKTLTSEQLANGAAVDIVAQKYAGFARNEADTLGGALAMMNNAWGELKEAMGSVVTENESVRVAIRGVGQVFDKLTGFVNDNKKVLGQFVTQTMASVVKGFGFMISVIGDTMVAWEDFKGTVVGVAITWSKAMRAIEFTDAGQKTLDDRISALTELQNGMAAGANNARVLNEKIQATAVSIGALGEGMADFGAEGVKATMMVTNGMNGVAIAADVAGDAWLKTVSEKDWSVNFEAIFDDTQVKELLGTTLKDAAVPESFSEFVKRLGKSIMNATIDGVNAASGGLKSFMSWFGESLATLIAGAIGGPLGEIIGKLAPAIGSLFESLVDFNAQAFEKSIDDFASGFENAMKNLGPAMDILGRNLDDITVAFFRGLWFGFASSMVALKDGMVRVADHFARYLSEKVNANWDGWDRFTEGVENVAKAIANAFIWALNKAIQALNWALPDILFGEIPSIPRLHSGGIVPGTIGQEVPIMALAGERVLPIGESGGGSQAITVNLTSTKLSPGEVADDVLMALRMLVRRGDIPSGAILAGQGV